MKLLRNFRSYTIDRSVDLNPIKDDIKGLAFNLRGLKESKE